MKKLLLASVLAFMSSPMIANAQPGDWPQDVLRLDVPYGDLNLTNEFGAQTLLRRIKFAAIRVCGGAPDGFDPTGRRQFRACMRTAMDDAVAQAHVSLVTALYTGQSEDDPRFASGYPRC